MRGAIWLRVGMLLACWPLAAGAAAPTHVQAVRVLGIASRRSRNCSATASTTSFSRKPVGPMAPGSSPPWPASIATSTSRRALRAGAGSARAATSARGASRGYRSITRRWFLLPTGGSRKDFGRVPGATSMTTRKAPSVGRPERSPRTRPRGPGVA